MRSHSKPVLFAPPHAARRRLWLLAAGLCAVVLSGVCAGSSDAIFVAGPRFVSSPEALRSLRALPARMAWAWERREDLRWLPADAGVAYVAVSLWLEGDTVARSPRANPLRVAEHTALVPVVHVDASTRKPPRLSGAQQKSLVDELLRAAASARSNVVQLDFEARLSQRAFLADVVREARAALPPGTALSITALASWCAGDIWMHQLPVDEIVPMAFRMSRDTHELRAMLIEQGGFPAADCQDAIGTATDEPLSGLKAARHYVFSPRAWTPVSWHSHPFSGSTR